MWSYDQSTGRLSHDGIVIAIGYSGHLDGKNNPAMESHSSLGPCPRGMFTLELIKDASGVPCDYEEKRAPVFRLIPDASTEMFGREGFLMHGDSITAPGTASLGCIVVSHDARFDVMISEDTRIQVT